MNAIISADVRALIVSRLGAALAEAWRQQRERDDGVDEKKDLTGASNAGQVRL